jgi:hypothetical protein
VEINSKRTWTFSAWFHHLLLPLSPPSPILEPPRFNTGIELERLVRLLMRSPPRRTHTFPFTESDRFLLTERSFCADTRAGMAHAHWLMTWFNVNGTRRVSPPFPSLEIPKHVQAGKTAKFCLKKS